MTIRHAFVFVCTFVLFFVVTISTVAMETTSTITPHTQENPDLPTYAKWGRAAMVEVKKKYPHAEIYDYKHVGRERSGQSNTEVFHLWIRENKVSQKIAVRISFDQNSEVVTNVSVYPLEKAE